MTHRRTTVAALLFFVATACGAYGEGGFTGRNPLRPARFIEEVDERCQAANEDLDERVARVLDGRETSADDFDDAVDDLRSVGDELVEELDEVYGPDNLESRRDELVDVLEEVDDLLADAGHPDDEADLLTQVKARFASVEADLREAGFRVCGTPRPTG